MTKYIKRKFKLTAEKELKLKKIKVVKTWIRTWHVRHGSALSTKPMATAVEITTYMYLSLSASLPANCIH